MSFPWRDAVRLASQSAVSAVLVYTLMHWWGMSEKFLGVLSAVLVIKVSVGGSWGKAWERFASTLLGCFLGTLCLWLVPNGYGTTVSLAVSMFVINAIAGVRPEWRYGVVAAVALVMGAESEVWQTSVERISTIGLGVLVGAVTSVLIWPEKASARALRHLRRALALIGDYLQYAMQQTYEGDEEDFQRFTNPYSTHISAARSAAAQVRIADDTHLHEQIHAVDRLYYSVTLIKRVAENTDQIHGKHSGIQSILQKIVELCHQNIKQLSAKPSSEKEQRMQNVEQIQQKRSQLEKLFEQQNNSDVPDADNQRKALLFALMEIEEGLLQLHKL